MTISESDAAARRHRLPGPLLLLVFCLAEIAGMAGFASFAALLPAFAERWNLSSTEAGWINGIYLGAYMVAVPWLSSLTDRMDARPVYILSALLTALASLGFAFFAEGFWIALICRALAGVGLAGTYMPGLKALTDRLPLQARSRYVAFYTSSFSIGAAVSFYLTGLAAGFWDWRWAVGLAAVGPLIGLAMIGGLAGPELRERPKVHDTRLLDFRPVLRNRRAFGYVLAYWAHNWELFAYRSWLVAFLVFAQELAPAGALGRDWSATTISSLVILLGLPSSVLANEISERFGRKRVVTTIMLASALLAALFGFAADLPPLLLIGLALAYGVTVTADSASITAGAIGAAEPHRRGATMAVHSVIGFLGAFLGPLVFGVVLDLAGGSGSGLAWGLAFLSSALAVACGPLALAVLDREPKQS